MMRAAEEGPEQDRFKIEISIKILGYSVKFNVRKKKGEKSTGSTFYRNVILLPRLDSKKFWQTAMADTATN